VVPPAVVTPAQNVLEAATYGATFTVNVTGTAPFGYQWFFDGSTALPGATNATLALTDLTTNETGSYTVVVSNAGGSASSSTNTLTVSQALSLITLAGTPTEPGTANGFGEFAQFENPQGVAVDASGNVYVADEAVHTIRKVTASGVVSTFAGQTGNPGFGDGTGADARFNDPIGVAVDTNGNVYVADYWNVALRKITPTGVVSTLAQGLSGRPQAVAVGLAGNYYLALNDNTIQVAAPNGTTNLVAGQSGVLGSADGTNSGALFNNPSGLAVDSAGNLYVADTGNNTIRMISFVSGNAIVKSVAGQAQNAAYADGIGTNALFNYPVGLAFDNRGNLFVADADNQVLRKMTPTNGTWIVATVAGQPGIYSFSDGLGSASGLNYPTGLASDSSGNIYMGDTANFVIRKGVIGPYIVGQPQSQSVQVSNAVTFTVPAAGATPLGYQWQLDGSDIAGATASSLILSSVRNADVGSYVVIVTNVGGSATSLVATLTVTYPNGATVDPLVTAAPVGESVTVGSAASLTVTASGTGPLSYQWYVGNAAVAGATNSTLDFTNLTGASGGRYEVVVSNAADSVTTAPVSLIVSTPLSIVTLAGGEVGFANGQGIYAQFNYPAAVATDLAGNIYVVDNGNSMIREITPDGAVSTLAGQADVPGYVDAIGTNALFNNPVGLAVDAGGNVYVADNYNMAIREIFPGGEVITLATGFYPSSVTVDAVGNVFAGSSDNSIRQIAPDGTIQVIAGIAGVPGDADGLGVYARFSSPSSIAVDSDENLYVGDQGNFTIRKITFVGTNWLTTTLAGQPGNPGSIDGLGSNAQFGGVGYYGPGVLGVAVDAAGLVYVADGYNEILREVRSNGVVATVAGLAGNSGSADATGVDASFWNPIGISVDSSENVYIADAYNNRIRKGVVGVTFVTQPESQSVAVGGSAVFDVSAAGAPPLEYQWLFDGVALAGATNTSLAVNDARHPSEGSYTVVVSNPGDSVTSMVATLTVTYPPGTPVDPALIAPPESELVTAGDNAHFDVTASGTAPFSYQWLFDGQNISGATNGFLYLANVLAGAGGSYSVVVSNAGGSVTSAPALLTVTVPLTVATLAGPTGFLDPGAMALDAADDLFVCDSQDNTIRKVSPVGQVSIVAGTPGVAGSADGTNGAAEFSNPQGIVAYGKGTVFVSDFNNQTIRQVTHSGTNWIVTAIAGSNGVGGANNGFGSAAQFNGPGQLTADTSGNLYVPDYWYSTIRKVAPVGTNWQVTTIAGLAGAPSGSADGIGSGARFNGPTSVAIDANNNIFVADQGNSTIRMMTLQDGVWLVTTVAGSPGNGGSVDGFGSAARFNQPQGVAVDGNGNVYVADAGNDTIREMTLSGSNWLVTTLAGSAGNAGDTDGVGSAARFYLPIAVAANAAGNIYIADSDNNLIRKGGFYPAILGLPRAEYVALNANVTISTALSGTAPLAYQWQFNGTNIAGATQSGLSLSAVSYAADGSYELFVTNNYGAATSLVAALDVLAPPAITVQPGSAIAAAAENATFTVGATGDSLAYQWQFDGGILPGATGSSLVLSNVTGALAGSYMVIVSNPIGAVTSSVSTLTVEGTAIIGHFSSPWTASNSPYVINGHATVNNLTIQPGVTVLMNGPYSIRVTNLLLAIGTSNQPIIFAAASPQIGWFGLRFVSAKTNSTLSWCVISNATAGGVRFTNTPFTMTHCLVESNSGISGGGVFTDSTLVMQDCILRDNAATYETNGGNYFVRGGGLCVSGGSATLLSCAVSNNTAIMPDIGQVVETSTGGGIDCESGSVTLNDCLVVNNTAVGAGLSATALGGGVYADDEAATLDATGSVFAGNVAGAGFGGAVAVGNSALLACVFSGNNATYGGAWYIGGAAELMATNCLVFANSAAVGGAAYSTASQAAGSLENCTLTQNSPDALNSFTGTVHDSVLYFDGTEIVPGPVTNPVVNYCDVQGGYAGSNNLNVDPRFANSTNFVLAPDSPAIDAGDPAPQFADEAFPPSAGAQTNDMGAYGGPGAAFWPSFAVNTPVVVANGLPLSPYQMLQLSVTGTNVISFTNGYPGGHFEYTVNGSNPLDNPTFTTSPFVLTNTGVIRAIAYSADYASYSIAAPVTVEVLPSYTLTAGTAGGGGVFPTGGLYFSNTVVTLTATNAPGWTFLNWAGGASGTNNPLQVVVNSSNSIQAVFGTPLAVGAIGGGTVQVNPHLSLYPYGSTAQIMALPNAGSTNIYFRFWGGAAVGQSVSPLDFAVTEADTNITAVFGGLPAGDVALNLLVNGVGNVAPAPLANSYVTGTMVTLTASPGAGYAFTGWSGGALGSNNPLALALNTNTTVTANFHSTNETLLPPAIAITNPAAGAQFTLPATITINASASDTNAHGAVEQVAFFAGTNLLGVVTNSPFTFQWTNPPAGSIDLSAVAVDNFGLSSNSAPVSVEVLLPPPGTPSFSLGGANYSVLGNGGSVSVTVLKSLNSLGGSVNYATANGTAVAVSQGVGNYQAAIGPLTFAEGQTSTNVIIPIVDNLVYEGNTTFTFALTPPGDGSSTVGSPGSATITIIDVNQPTTTNSVLAAIFPSPVPESDGSLEVGTQPPGAQGQWRFAWETVWHNSGDIVGGLPTGNYPVTFSPVAGYTQPADTTIPVIAGELSVETNNQYAISGMATYGSLAVTLEPTSLAGAQWQLEGDTNWYPSGFVRTNLISGNHILEFQTVPGWVSPSAEVVYVGGNLETSLEAEYLVAATSDATTPGIVQFSDATTPEFGLPYVYNGQLLTDVGSGSGCVVQPRVVLTGGHMVFSDLTLSFVENVYWFFQEYAGTYDPPAQTPAGWYIFNGYASARSNDLANGISPGVESPVSENLDVATLYFLSDAGRGGSSGYLVSGSNTTEWLQATALKTLVGYPAIGNGNNTVNPGQMYATGEGNYEFDLITNSVFSTEDIIGFPGNSGGPLCVQYTNGIYYPAGVYLGGSNSSIVRAIDGDVATLINAANVTANTGQLHANGGPLGPGNNSGKSLGTGSYTMQLGPPAAVAAGAGWMVTGQGVSTYYTDTAVPYSLPSGSYTATFNTVPGFTTPAPVNFTIIASGTIGISVTYTAIITQPQVVSPSFSNHELTLGISASAGESVAIDRSTNLPTWVALVTNVLPASGTTNFTDTILTNAPRAFYRARVVP
jgi:sugar lactone lactonase YvrE